MSSYMTNHSEAVLLIREQHQMIETLVAALDASLSAADGHYAHWDPKGTAGANCPACKARAQANNLARFAISRANPVTSAIASGRAPTMEEVGEVVKGGES